MSSPVRSLCKNRPNWPAYRSSERWALTDSSCADTTPYEVKEFLAMWPEFVEDYLIEQVECGFIESVLAIQRESRKQRELVRLRALTYCGMLDDHIILADTANRILNCSTTDEFCKEIHALCMNVSVYIDSDSCNLYVINSNQTRMERYEPAQGKTMGTYEYVGPVGTYMTVSAHAAAKKISLNVSDVVQDVRFPKGIGLGDEANHYVICVPILLESGRCYAVAEFERCWDKNPFCRDTFELINACLTWIASCVQRTKKNKVLSIQSTLNSYLLETTKVMFDDIDNIEELVKHIMSFTKDIVGAEKSSLFLVNAEKREMYANYFDEDMYTNKSAVVRFSIDRGIAGHVARTGSMVNIQDAYRDKRFNKEVDKKTGFRTKNILCMPIHDKNAVLGVVQMINKLENEKEGFSDDDVEALESFAVYCAFALHYSHVYNHLSKQKTQCMVALEVLDFHVVRPLEEVPLLMANPHLAHEEVPKDFYTFDYFCWETDSILPQLYIMMIHDLFGEKLFDMPTLCRFILCVRRGYRPISYHNWQHAFHVAHSIWMMVRNSSTVHFTKLEKIALMIAGICHDLDHRGFNNDFYKKMHHPLAALYHTNTMEHHHYRLTVTILHASGLDVLKFLSTEDHSEVLNMIRSLIIATDLALFISNQKYITDLLKVREFNIATTPHRDAMLALMMTSADCCAAAKPIDTLNRTLEDLHSEFYMQGDEERKAGFAPLPMMDRHTDEDISTQQASFIIYVVRPMHAILAHLLPETRPVLDGTMAALAYWKAQSAEHGTHKRKNKQNKTPSD